MKKILIYVSAVCFCIFFIPMIIVLGGAGSSFLINDNSVLPTENNPQNSINIEETPPAEILQEDIVLDIYNKDTKSIFQMNLEEYIACVVIAEMPAYFEIEALKAQSVAARTYTYRKVLAPDDDHEGMLCTESAHCQAFRDLKNVTESTPNRLGVGAMSAQERIAKVKQAVEDTKGIIICHDGMPIEALYHSCSGGMTEDAENVWGNEKAYLKAVESHGEEAGDTKYKQTISFSKTDFIKKMKAEYSEIMVSEEQLFSSIKNVRRSESGRVLTLTIGNIELTGKELRTIFKINSTNIQFKENKENIEITTLGYGHGVGMSQFGADARAKEGKAFQEILKHYYTGVELQNIG